MSSTLLPAAGERAPASAGAGPRREAPVPRDPARKIEWVTPARSTLREYLEVLVVISAVTLVGWLEPFDYRAFGHVYLLAVILLSLRVGRWPVLVAAFASAVAWEYMFIPPKLSFSMLDLEDDAIVGTYFVGALIAGQLTARIRAQEQTERRREQRATALLRLTQALAEAVTLDEAVAAALRQIDNLFGARSALWFRGQDGAFALHPAGSFVVDADERLAMEWACRHGREAGRGTTEHATAAALHVPLVRAGAVLGVLIVAPEADAALESTEQRELIAAFAAQIALLVEREHLRAAGEREKLLAESDRLHRTLLDSVSHELKTPLAVLRAATDTLGRPDGDRREALIGEIRTATGRLDRLVANLLDQTRLEAGAVRPQPDWCDARDIVGAARRGLGEALAGRAVRVDLPADLPLFSADARLMEQVLANLLLNAALHTPAGTPVTVAGGVDEAGTRLWLAVTDAGPGIAPEMRAHLFEKFRRGPQARAGGVGLGLSIVRGLMLAQGGGIAAEDAPGGGARFVVFLPLISPGHVPNE